jgi:TolB-like protein/class 3 adenylate cyclase
LAREQRRLAAIVATDVVGYSRLMGRDESGTLARLREHRKLRLEPTLARYGGRLVKLTGDGALAEFPSAVDALGAAIEFQQAMAEANQDQSDKTRIVFRIGLHLGDLIVEGDDLYGDGVNVAARLEAVSPPGGVVISRTVHEAVVGRLEATFEDLGSLVLKNIERPIQAFGVKWDPAGWQLSATSAVSPSIGAVPLSVDVPLTLPDKPSIAVLPFQNMSGDPEQEYFADGIAEDLITALSRVHWLFVIARNSSFANKGSIVDARLLGQQLAVRYVLEGSVRKAGHRVRITGQLVDTETGGHIWAERFDGSLENIFDLQDTVTASIVGVIAPKLELAEIERSKRKRMENLDAYDYYLRAMASFHRGTSDSVNAALKLFYKAIELDAECSPAYGMACLCYVFRRTNIWLGDRDGEIDEVIRLARQAARFGKDDAIALSSSGFVIAQIAGDLGAGAALIDRALALDPNSAAAWLLSGWVRVYLDEPELAVEHFGRAMRLNPFDPFLYGMQNGTAAAYFLAARYDEATSWAEKALREQPRYLPALRMAAASHALASRHSEARKAVSQMTRISPSVRLTRADFG